MNYIRQYNPFFPLTNISSPTSLQVMPALQVREEKLKAAMTEAIEGFPSMAISMSETNWMVHFMENPRKWII